MSISCKWNFQGRETDLIIKIWVNESWKRKGCGVIEKRYYVGTKWN